MEPVTESKSFGQFSQPLVRPNNNTSGSLEDQEIKVREKVTNLVLSLNENLCTNYLLREFIKEDIQILTEEEFNNWLTTNNWGKLKKNPDQNYSMPLSVSEAFQALKNKIIKFEAKNDSSKPFRSYCFQIFKDSHQKISQEKSIIAGLGSLSNEFIGALEGILQDSQVITLEDRVLLSKMRSIFYLLSLNHSSLSERNLSGTLVSLFGESFGGNRIDDIVRNLSEYSPYKIPFVERILHQPNLLIGKIICFALENIILSTRIIVIKKDVNKILIEGENKCCLELTLGEEKKRIEKIVWVQTHSESLYQFLSSVNSSKTCRRIYANPEKITMNPLKEFFDGSYKVKYESVDNGPFNYQFRFIPENPADSSLLDHATNKKHRKEIVCQIDSQNKWRIVGEKEKPVGLWPDFCKLFEVENDHIYNQIFDQHLQNNRLYITETEPLSNNSIKERLKKEREVSVALIKSLNEKDFKNDPYFDKLFRCLVNGEESSNQLKKIIANNRSIRQQLNILCDLKEISSQEDKELLLLNFIQKVNFLQLKEKNKGAEAFVMDDYMHLTHLLGQSLKRSETLKGKRGILFLGSTGSGKSASVAYLMGIPMKVKKNRFGETYVVTQTESENQESQPKIGHSLRVSETVFTTPYVLENTKVSMGIGRRQQVKEIKFPQGIIAKDIRLLDAPGFNETRGTEYEIATNFSIDHSIHSIEEIEALVHVIDYSIFLSQKSSLFMKELEELCCRFPDILENSNLQKKVFFVITKHNGDITIENLKERVQQLLKEEKEKAASNLRSFSLYDFITENIPSNKPLSDGPRPIAEERIEDQKKSFKEIDKCELLQFFLKQLIDEKVELLLPNSAEQRIDFLNKILKSSDPTEKGLKSTYQMSLSHPSMLLQFSQVVGGAIAQWKAIFDVFFDLSTYNKTGENLKTLKKMIIEKTVEQRNQAQKLKQFEKLILICKNIKEQSLQNIELLDAPLLEQIQRVQRTHTSQISDIIKELENEIRSLETKALQNRNEHKIALKNNKEYRTEIEKMTIELEKFSNGTEDQNLTNIFYEASSTFSMRKLTFMGKIYRLFSNGLAGDIKKAVEKGDDSITGLDDPNNFSDKEIFSVKEVTTNSHMIISISKDYQLIPNMADDPNPLQKLNQIRNGQKIVTFDSKGYSISIEKNKVDFIEIRSHNDGKKISYGIIQKFDGKAPYPQLVITHTIPKQELYKVQIATLTDQISRFKEKQESEEKSIRELNAIFEDLVKEKQTKKESLEKKERELAELKKDVGLECLNLLIEKYQSECEAISLGLNKLEKDIKELKGQEALLERKKEELLFERKRWALFIKSNEFQLIQSLNIAQFFILNQKNFSLEILSHTTQARLVVNACVEFIDLYQAREKELSKEIQQLLGAKFDLTPNTGRTDLFSHSASSRTDIPDSKISIEQNPSQKGKKNSRTGVEETDQLQ